MGEVGLGYLQLSRSVTTLSGGEGQRIRLAAQLGSNLSGVLYVLDEPTIGLHARDNQHLLDALEKLRARGNSSWWWSTMKTPCAVLTGFWIWVPVLVCEGASCRRGHSARSAPPPGFGDRSMPSRTAPATSPRRAAPRRSGWSAQTAGKSAKANASAISVEWLTVHRARLNNLKDVTASFPLGRLVVVTGVSGSGKSTLVKECLVPGVRAVLAGEDEKKLRGLAGGVSGLGNLRAVHEVDQTPIGRTPRSTPATYVGFFDDIRALFALVPEARMRGYGPGRFSFNSSQGRCPHCEGAGVVKMEMNFLPTASVGCEACGGKRFNAGTLEIRYQGKSIAEVLQLSVAEGIEFFAHQTRLRRPLEALRDTGLEYLQLGQISPTLSGGEAQRIKLVTHLLGGLKSAAIERENADLTARKASGRSLPRDLCARRADPRTAHQDVRRLVAVLQRLVDAGHSVIVIEHNLDLIAEADWIVDLGPEGLRRRASCG